MHLTGKDTALTATDLLADEEDRYGLYHYQYSEEGSQGSLQVEKLGKDKIAFSIFSVTSAPARNIADVQKDTVSLTGNSFVYTIPGSDSCAFKVSFYKGFVQVNYTKGYCSGQFGMNATVDGVFVKVDR